MMLELLLILSLITCTIFIIYILRRNNSNLNVSDQINDIERAEKAVDNFIDLKVSISKLSKPNKDLNHIK